MKHLLILSVLLAGMYSNLLAQKPANRTRVTPIDTLNTMPDPNTMPANDYGRYDTMHSKTPVAPARNKGGLRNNNMNADTSGINRKKP